MHRRAFLETSGRAAILAGLVPSLLTACRKGAEHPREDAGFIALRDRYFLRSLELNPVTATYLGGDAYHPSLKRINGQLRDWRPDSLANERSFLEGVEQERTAIDPATLSPQARIDHALLGAQIAFLLRQSGERKHWQRAIDTYVAEPFRGVDWQIQGMTSAEPATPPAGDSATAEAEPPLGTEEEWGLVVERVSRVPEYLEVAKQNLLAGKEAGNLPDWRMVERDGVNGSRANAEYFRKDLLASATQHLGNRPFARATLGRLEQASEKAAQAWEGFATFLLQTFDPTDRQDRFAAGEEEYAWRVKNCLRLDRNLEDLFAYGAAEVARYEEQLFSVAREVASAARLSLRWGSDADKRASTRAVTEHLAKDAPRNDDELFQWYREAGERAVAWGRTHQLFDIPADYRLDVLPTPPVLRSTIDAAYYPAPPLKPGGTGRFYLTPTGNDPATLALNNRASVADTAVHEGFPGHDWHFKFMTAHAAEISNIRWFTPGAVEDSSAMWQDSMATEGWGLYAEELMAEPLGGSPHGFYSAAEKLYELQGQLLRAVRVRVDIGIHTGRMKYDEAVDYFAEHVSFYPGARAAAGRDPTARAIMEGAERAIYRYSKWPTQAITYNLGKREIQDLRAALAEREGAQFSPRQFHERLMRLGTIPAGYVRPLLLGTP